jgi:hypothetical protein
MKSRGGSHGLGIRRVRCEPPNWESTLSGRGMHSEGKVSMGRKLVVLYSIRGVSCDRVSCERQSTEVPMQEYSI